MQSETAILDLFARDSHLDSTHGFALYVVKMLQQTSVLLLSLSAPHFKPAGFLQKIPKLVVAA